MTSPRAALHELQRAADFGELDRWCQTRGIALMVVFGSTADPAPHTPPEDLDVAVLFAGAADLLGLVNDLADWLHVEVDVMDLARAGIVARDQALRLASRSTNGSGGCSPAPR